MKSIFGIVSEKTMRSLPVRGAWVEISRLQT